MKFFHLTDQQSAHTGLSRDWKPGTAPREQFLGESKKGELSANGVGRNVYY
jgi:hypothetical protein